MAYIGTLPNSGQNRKLDDISSSFNGSTTTFDLQVDSLSDYPGIATSLLISVGGVVQEPDSAFNLNTNGRQIIFTTAPDAGKDFFGVVLGAALDINTPADASVTSGKIASGAVTAIKLGDPLGFANVAGNVSIGRGLAVGWTDGKVPPANLTVKGNTFLSGATVINSITYPSADGDASQIIKTDGSGTLSFTTASEGGGYFKGSQTTGNSTTGPGDIFRINRANLNANATITTSENASCTGPMTILNQQTLTVNGTLVVI